MGNLGNYPLATSGPMDATAKCRDRAALDRAIFSGTPLSLSEVRRRYSLQRETQIEKPASRHLPSELPDSSERP